MGICVPLFGATLWFDKLCYMGRKALSACVVVVGL